MLILTVGLSVTIVGVLIHILLLRRLSGPLLFTSMPMLLLFVFAIAWTGCALFIRPIGIVDAFLALTLSMSLGLCYVLLLVGVIYDSPTLALTNAIGDYGPDGMPSSEMPEVARRHPFVESRLAALVASGQIAVEGNDFVATQPATSFLIRLGAVYRRLRGAQAPTG